MVVNMKLMKNANTFGIPLIPIGVCLREYPDLLFVAIGAVANLGKILISLESHYIDIPETPDEDRCHLSV